MIIWSGKGYLVAIIIFGCSLTLELITEAIFQDDKYYQTHSVPLASAFLIAGMLTSILGRHLIKTKTFIDKQTGEEIIVKNENSFFFIPMEYWGAIFFLISLGILLFKNQ